jgi:phosphate transport system protein
MPRESFHRELDRLVEKVVELGREVESCLDAMVEALEKHDAEAASNQLGVDAHYKERGTQIAEECMILQARQAPVAVDLRLIHVLQAVTNHCVRAGTLCEHTCCEIAETRNAERDSDLAATLREMAHGARDLFRRGLNVFETRDIEHSEELEAADDWVDLMYSEAMNLVVNPGDK